MHESFEAGEEGMAALSIPTREAADISQFGSETAPASFRCTEAAKSWDGDSLRRSRKTWG